jgi:hypothetical protein
MRAQAVVALLGLAATAPASAQGGGTHVALVSGAHAPLGDFGSRYGLGFIVGVEASLMPAWIGAVWSFQYTWFWSREDPRNVDVLELVDLDAALRVRLAVTSTFPLFVIAQAGVGLVRTSEPLEPDLDTSFIGPTAGLGVELAAWAPLVLAVAGDFSYLKDGPTGVRVLVTVGLGSR